MISSISQLKLYAAKLKPNPEIDSTYQADGLNMETLDRELYTDVTFFNVRHPDLLYCFQMLFPPFTIVLLVVYGCSSYYSVKAYVEKHTKYSTSWATATAHAVLSLAFTLFVVILDILALIFRKAAPDYYTESFHAPLFHYPGLTLFWDGIALTTIMTVMILAMIIWGCCQNDKLSCLKKKINKKKIVFLLLLFAGVVPLLCFASHAHYIFIAAITDPFYATGIGIYYGIFYYFHLSFLTQIYEGVDQCAPNVQQTSVQQVDHRNDEQARAQQDNQNIEEYVAHFNYKAMICVFVVFLVTVCYQALITAFYVFLPINESVESLPSHLFRILQVASSLLVSLLAYKIIFGIQSTPSLSAISSAIRNFLLKKKDENANLRNKRNWDCLDVDKKLTHLLHELYDSMIIRVTPVNQQQQSQDQPPEEQPPKEQSPKEQRPMEQSPKVQPPKEQPPMEQSTQELPPHAQEMIELQQLEQQQTSHQRDQRETQ